MFVHYILLNNIINLTDYYIGIPIDNRQMLALNLVIGGIFLFLILYYYKKYGDRNYDANNKKVVTANNCRYRCG